MGVYVYKLDPDAGEVVGSTELRCTDKCHGIFPLTEGFFTLEVCGNTVKNIGPGVSPSLEAIPWEYKTKGMCGDESSWATTVTSRAPTETGSRFIQVKNWHSDQEGKLEYQSQWVEGLVVPQDMRQIDGFDKCHLNPFSFPYKGF